jgi:hypothetical protein
MVFWDWKAWQSVGRMIAPLFYVYGIGADPAMRAFGGGHLQVRINAILAYAVGLGLIRTSEVPCVFAWSRIWLSMDSNR